MSAGSSRQDDSHAVRHGGEGEASRYHLVIDAISNSKRTPAGRSSRPGAQSSSPDISGMSSSTSRTCPSAEWTCQAAAQLDTQREPSSV